MAAIVPYASMNAFNREEGKKVSPPRDLLFALPFSVCMQHYLGGFPLKGSALNERAMRLMDRTMDTLQTDAETMQAAIEALCHMLRTAWEEVGISSLNEFVEKKAAIEVMRRPGIQANCALAIEADLALVRAVKGHISPQHEHIVKNFWEQVALEPSLFEQYEKVFGSSISEIMLGIQEIIVDITDADQLNEKINDLLAVEHAKVQTFLPFYSYLILQAELKVPSLLDMIQRPVLRALALKTYTFVPSYSSLEAKIVEDMGVQKLSNMWILPEMRMSPEELTDDYFIRQRKEELEQRISRFQEKHEESILEVALQYPSTYYKDLTIVVLQTVLALIITQFLATLEG